LRAVRLRPFSAYFVEAYAPIPGIAILLTFELMLIITPPPWACIFGTTA
jgi:hypothetical protein